MEEVTEVCKEVTLTREEQILQFLFNAVCQALREREPNIPDLTGSTKSIKFVLASGGWVRDKLLNHVSMDIDLIVPDKTSYLFCSLLEEELKSFESTIEGFKFKYSLPPNRQEDAILNLGYCQGLMLCKRNLEIWLEGEPEHYKYELDIREVRAGETFHKDKLTRDFTVNSAYFDFIDGRVIDIADVVYWL